MAGSFPMLSAHNTSYSVKGEEIYRAPISPISSRSERGDYFQTAEQAKQALEARGRSISKSYRKLVFTDPVAFRYLEEDESTTVLARRERLEGYELYVVEQWIVSRTHATFTICTYTGDVKHSVLVNVLAVPQDQSTWSKRLQVYFEAISQSYAREKETHLGALMVTNLSGFPSSLNVIAVPDGDVKRHREDFIVNEDLKRMGCAGRAAMSLQYPPTSTIQKFHRMYRTSEKVPLYVSVMEVVRFCQISLVLYGKLDASYADGLLCDITEKAITAWWNEIGIDFHNVEPSDGILGPTTVSALIGLIIGAYNRLKETGAPIGKDPLDLSSMKRAIGHFQKANKMDRNRRLDRATLDRLHRVTANKAEDEGLAVARALKSTVGAFSGKGGEMIARGFGGGKDKAGIAEVETLDIERLAQLVTGRSMKWLWQGKDKGLSSAGTAAPSDELNGKVFSTDDQGGFIWTGEVKDGQNGIDPAVGPDANYREKRRLRDAVSRSYAGRNRHTDDEGGKHDHLDLPQNQNGLGQSSHRSSRSHGSPITEFPPWNQDLANAPVTVNEAESAKDHGRDRSGTNLTAHRQALRGIDHRGRESPSKRRVQQALARIKEDLKDERYQKFSGNLRFEQPQTKGLRRSVSAINLRGFQESRKYRLPRHLSYSIVTDAIEYQDLSDDSENADDEHDAEVGLSVQGKVKVRKEQLRRSQELGSKIFGLNRGIVPFAETRIVRVENIEEEASGQLDELNNIYYQHLEEYQTLQATSTDLVAREKSSLNEAMKSIDMLGQKLDYEVDSLQSRMQEVEESVDDFERRVLDIENSIKLLVSHEEKPHQPAWYERWFGVRKHMTAPEQDHKEEVIANEPKLLDAHEMQDTKVSEIS